MTEGTDFLYPFIEGGEQDAAGLLADLATSAAAKGAISAHLQAVTLADRDAVMTTLAQAMAQRFSAGGRLFVFGNGGSATDAAGIVALFRTPPWGRALRARSLVADHAVLTALGNDVGFELVFSRQLIAYAQEGDMALGLSTSGNSTNLLSAFAEARRRGLLTLGLAGSDGGQMAASSDVEHCLVVPSSSVHRIQETQTAMAFELWSRVQSLV
ncbi:MAG TPA: SIS domain-containing protein [Acidimicrobiales bacterium]|jgi:D-sedoheptulose 7-phosphate isomerase|nr:SIS domain-containing protein [Acidimicrobiales bacterium]